MMKRLIRVLVLTAFSFAFIGVIQPFAAEWYESMESSGIDQSYAVLKTISTSGSPADRQDVQQAIAAISESISRETIQAAESSSREHEASRLTVNVVDADENGITGMTGISDGKCYRCS